MTDPKPVDWEALPLTPADEVALRIVAERYTDQASAHLRYCFATIDAIRAEVKALQERVRELEMPDHWVPKAHAEAVERIAESEYRLREQWHRDYDTQFDLRVAAEQQYNDLYTDSLIHIRRAEAAEQRVAELEAANALTIRLFDEVFPNINIKGSWLSADNIALWNQTEIAVRNARAALGGRAQL